MARNRKRKTTIGSFTEDQIRRAIRLVKERGLSIRQAAKELELSYVTLSRYIKKHNANPNALMRPKYESRLIFTKEQEQSLEEYLLLSSKMFYGLTSRDCKKLAFEMAVRNNISIPPSWRQQQIAGEEWYKGFRLRHANISCRKPEACSLARATSFNKHNVDTFFEKLKIVMQRNPHFADGTRVFNLDETSTTTVQAPKKVLAQKGSKQISQCTSGERGVLVTTCCIICASGYALPPAMIFPRVNFKPLMVRDAPVGTLGLATPSGWMNRELFSKVMQHFIDTTNSSKENPTLLIMDNHESHISIEVLDLAKRNGVTILTLPPHCSHRLQPLDVAVFGPFKSHYNSSIQNWLLQHPGSTVTLYDIGECVRKAHERSMTPSNITSGFRSTGIFPFDPNIFSADDFLCSEVTNRPCPEVINRPSLVLRENTTHSNNVENSPTSLQLPERLTAPVNLDNPLSHADKRDRVHLQKPFLSPKEFRGFPKADIRKNIRKICNRKKSIIATDTPEKEELERKDMEKKRKQKVKRETSAKKKVLASPVTSEDDQEEEILDLPSSDDENWIPEEHPSGFEELQRAPEENDFVLVEFKTSRNILYYVARIIQVLPKDEFLVTYLRKSQKMGGTFFYPNLEERFTVNLIDIKLLLPEPKKYGATKRQQAYLCFEVNFGTMDIH